MAATAAALAQRKKVAEMKTKSSKPKSPNLAECLDAVDAHLRAARTVAGLLELGLEIPSHFSHMDAEMVGDAGYLISQELRQTEEALTSLREAIKQERQR